MVTAIEVGNGENEPSVIIERDKPRRANRDRDSKRERTGRVSKGRKTRDDPRDVITKGGEQYEGGKGAARIPRATTLQGVSNRGRLVTR